MNNRKIGIVQALGLGYESVVRSIWVVLIPIGLDLFFWLGPHLSIQSMVERLVADMAAASQSTPDFAQNMEEMRAALTAVGWLRGDVAGGLFWKPASYSGTPPPLARL